MTIEWLLLFYYYYYFNCYLSNATKVKYFVITNICCKPPIPENIGLVTQYR